MAVATSVDGFAIYRGLSPVRVQWNALLVGVGNSPGGLSNQSHRGSANFEIHDLSVVLSFGGIATLKVLGGGLIYANVVFWCIVGGGASHNAVQFGTIIAGFLLHVSNNALNITE